MVRFGEAPQARTPLIAITEMELPNDIRNYDIISSQRINRNQSLSDPILDNVATNQPITNRLVENVPTTQNVQPRSCGTLVNNDNARPSQQLHHSQERVLTPNPYFMDDRQLYELNEAERQVEAMVPNE